MEKVLNKNLSCCKNKMAPQFGCTTKKVKNTGISLSKRKAEIMKSQIEFLGIQIDKNGIKMQTHIVQKIITIDENIDTKKNYNHS